MLKRAFGQRGVFRAGYSIAYVRRSNSIFNDGYSAPEIYRGKKVDKRADVFSAGALLYVMLTGERLEAESWREEGGPVRFAGFKSPLNSFLISAIIGVTSGLCAADDAGRRQVCA